MTCRHTMSLLEKFVDKELDQIQLSEIEQHLDSCLECNSEFREATRLKEMMTNIKVSLPGEIYWNETTDLILAKIENPIPRDHSNQRTYDVTQTKHSLLRAVVSFGVSLLVLFSAIWIGSFQEPNLTIISNDDQKIFVTTSLLNLNKNSNYTVLTKEEQTRLTRGMLMIGAPGYLGRSAMIMDLVSLASK